MAKLAGLGIPADAGDDLVTSAQAAARLLEPGTTALVCAGPGVEEALRARGVTTVRDGTADAVVVGWHTDFDYAPAHAAFRAVHAGARLIGTNDDATYPTPDGLLPGGGSILAAVATAAGVAPEIAGKPHAPMAALVRARLALDATGGRHGVGRHAVGRRELGYGALHPRRRPRVDRRPHGRPPRRAVRPGADRRRPRPPTFR